MKPIEIIGRNPDFRKHFPVEGGGQFEPFIVNPDTAIAVEDEDVAHDVGKFFWSFMVFDVGKIEFGGGFENPHHGGKEAGLRDAEAFTSL